MRLRPNGRLNWLLGLGRTLLGLPSRGLRVWWRLFSMLVVVVVMVLMLMLVFRQLCPIFRQLVGPIHETEDLFIII